MTGNNLQNTQTAVPLGRILTFQLLPMPSNAAVRNHISAGWLLSEMDKASGLRSHEYIYAGDRSNGGRSVTVGIDAMTFKKPLYAGDLVKIYTEVVRQGRSSMTMKTEAWAENLDKTPRKVTEGLFTFVAIDANKRPVEIMTNNTPQNPVLLPPGVRVRPSSSIITATPNAVPAGNPAMTRRPRRKDTNILGDVFGGWILSRMDDACAAQARIITGHHVASVALEAMTFHKPVFVNDTVTFHTSLIRTGRTSVTIGVETWAKRHKGGANEKVTEGLFTYVAIDKNFKPVVFSPPSP